MLLLAYLALPYCLVYWLANLSVLYALLVGYILFFCYALLKKHSFKEVMRMSLQGVYQIKVILLVLILVGIITATWRASGTIPFITYTSSHLIIPSLFILIVFLLNCVISVITGTSTGTAATIGIICMSLANMMGINEVLVGGAILSGVYFSDRSHPSRGLKKGVVVNIESTVQSIQYAIDEAQQMAGCQIFSAYVGIAGNHIRSLNSDGIVAIREGEVTRADIERVLDSAKAVAIPADQRVLHTLPQDYVIDNQEGVREPLGMYGVRLEAKVHVVTCAVNAAQNIEKCVRRCGLEVDDIILEQLASSYSVLTEDEKELGVCLVDVGGGTSDIAVYTEGAIRHTSVIPIAGDRSLV